MSLLYLIKDVKKISILHSTSYLLVYSSAELTEDPPESVGGTGVVGYVLRGIKLNRTPRNCCSQIYVMGYDSLFSCF